MTQNKLKLLAVLANLLATYLCVIDRKTTYDFVHEVQRLIEQSLMDLTTESDGQTERVYHEIKNMIPKSDDRNWRPPRSQFVKLED